MINNKVDILNATLTAYVIGNTPEIDINRKHPAVLILPGGGYEGTSDRESEPVALALLPRGYNAFVLKYSTGPDIKYPTHLRQAEAALAHIRENCDKYNTNPDRIAVMGFSAGGHLAGCLSNISEVKPNAAVLCYPVITSGEFAHKGSFIALGEDISLEKCVSKATPPTFIWHTCDDNCVPVENALLMANALQTQGVAFELHIFQSGVHGLSVCNEQSACNNDFINERASKWVSLCTTWLNKAMN